MNIFDTPETIDIGGIPLIKLNGLNWIEKEWYWRRQSKGELDQVELLKDVSTKLAAAKEITPAEASRLLMSLETDKSAVSELVEFTDLMAEIQQAKAVAEVAQEYELAAMLLAARVEDDWLKQNRDKLISAFGDIFPPDDKLFPPKQLRLMGSERFDFFLAIVRLMHPQILQQLSAFALAEITEGNPVTEEEFNGAGKLPEAAPNSSRKPSKGRAHSTQNVT